MQRKLSILLFGFTKEVDFNQFSALGYCSSFVLFKRLKLHNNFVKIVILICYLMLSSMYMPKPNWKEHVLQSKECRPKTPKQITNLKNLTKKE